MDTDDYLTLREVATALRVSLGTVRAYVRKGQLAAVRRGANGQWLVKRADVRAFLEAPGERPAPPSASRHEHEGAVKALAKIPGYRA